MTRLRTSPPPYSARTGVRPATVGMAAGAVTVALLLFLTAQMVEDPARVSRLGVSNVSAYQLEVSVGSPDRPGAQGLGAVQRDGSRQFEEVLDQGDRWIFRFAYGGVPAGEIEVSRADLARSRWTVTAPAEVDARLGAAELTPSSR